jgi:hypothetical protein
MGAIQAAGLVHHNIRPGSHCIHYVYHLLYDETAPNRDSLYFPKYGPTTYCCTRCLALKRKTEHIFICLSRDRLFRCYFDRVGRCDRS